MNLTDKIAIVTGAGQGIGKAIALRLANAGANVAIMDLNMAAAEAVAQEIEGIGRKGLPVQADVSQSADVNAAVEKVISTFGRVDILVQQRRDCRTYAAVNGLGRCGLGCCNRCKSHGGLSLL